jgi:hypothetical protein
LDWDEEATKPYGDVLANALRGKYMSLYKSVVTD